MASIDERVVSIKFDNASFQAKMTETIRSLDKLKNSLDFSTAKRGLDDLKTSGSNFNMSGVSNALEGISSKFTAMTAVGITALATITSHALAAGAQIAKAFTLDPITSGFKEYETQLNSVQTILANTASKGTTMDEVNSALQKLNEYSDQTIYNFGEMARNIGTFTAAGVDLDTSVSSIKGIANIAAMSGSNSEQAATAMYQLSQAISAGSVKLMDWNSVVNAGMGGEAFKSALFETGKAMGKLGGVPMGQTFTQWEDAGNSFRESLEKGWITSDVLTTTLSAFTGDMTEEMLLAKGFNAQQADAILKQAAIAKAAATQVKTFTQLMGTLKEAVGTGWADTFKIVIGNFEEAKRLWTGVNTFLGGVIAKSSTARNEMLEGWKGMGGRVALGQGLKDAFIGLLSVMMPIKAAFREIFPKKTVADLLKMTAAFAEFAKKLIVSGETADKIKRTFAGVFAVLEIGWTVIKELAKLIGSLIHALAPAGSGLLSASAGAGDFAVALNKLLVEGGGIHDFFVDLGEIIKKAIGWLLDVKDAIVDFFTFDIGTGPVSSGMEDVSDKAKGLSGVTDALSATWDRFTQRMASVGELLGKVGDVLKTFASGLGDKLSEAFGEADFDKGIDVLNVALFAGIGVVLQRMVSAIKKFDITGGFMEKVNGILDETRKTLKTFQLDIKAKALLKIAIAMAVLTASLVVLSMIDSAALTKALVAMGVGFGQLVGVMTLMDKTISTGWDAAKIAGIAGAMILMAVAMGILAISIMVLSKLDNAELARGLVGIAVGMGVMVGAVKLMTRDKEELLASSFVLLGLAAGLLILSLAVKAFASMDAGEMAKGLIGISAGLFVLTMALNRMDNATLWQKSGFAVVAFGLKILADAVKLFGDLDLGTIIKGLVGIAFALKVIGEGMEKMPKDMLGTSAALLIVATALLILGTALGIIGGMDLGTLAKGVLGILATLVILSMAMHLMKNAEGGALSLIVIAGALFVLTNVIKTLGEMDIMTIIQGLIALAAIIAVLGLAAFLMQPLLPALLGLGIALSAVGIGIALFGIGAMFLAKAFEIMAVSGVAGAKAIVESIDILMSVLPKLTAAITQMVVAMVAGFVEAVPQMIEMITKLLDALLGAIIKMAPKVAEAFVTLVTEALRALSKIYPEIVATGMALIMALLTGIRDNIYQVVTVAVEIIVNFINGIAANLGLIIEAATNLILTLLTELGAHAVEFAFAGLTILLTVIQGITDNVIMIVNAVVNLITTFLAALAGAYLQLIQAGATILITLLQGIAGSIFMVVDAVANIVLQFITALALKAQEIIDAGFALLMNFLAGISNNILKVAEMVTTIIITFINELGNKAREIMDAGANMLIKLLEGVENNMEKVIKKGVAVAIAFLEAMSSNTIDFVSKAADVLVAFLNGMAQATREKSEMLRKAGMNLAAAIIDGMTFGLSSKIGDVISGAADVGGGIIGGIGGAIGSIGCPAKVFIAMGEHVTEGLVVGMASGARDAEKTAGNLADNVITSFTDTLNRIPDTLTGMDEFNPTITPVLDLSKVQSESAKLEEYMRLSPITPDVSFERARLSAIPPPDETTPPTTYTGPTEITFEQNIYSPTALSTNDIYRNTKSQIAIAKEALGIK